MKNELLAEFKDKELSEFSDDDYENLKSIIDNADLIENADEIKRLFKDSNLNDINFALLFAKCYSTLEMIVNFLKDDENDFREKVSKYLDKLNTECDASSFVMFIKDSKVKRGIGSNHYRAVMKSKLNKHIGEYRKLCLFFVRILED